MLRSALLSRAGRRAPDRGSVRDAVLLAQRGHEVLLAERGPRFRAVIVDRRPDRASLRVLTRVAGGGCVLASFEASGSSVAVPRRRLRALS